MKTESDPIPNWIRSFAAYCWAIHDSGRIHSDKDAMPIVIQSRSHEETDWRNEVWRRTRDEAYVLAKCKANLTGRIYRLVNDQGEVLEEVRHLGRIYRRRTD